MPPRALVLANPAASKAGPTTLATVLRALESAGWRTDVHEAATVDEVAATVAAGVAHGAARVVAIGGDGTVAEAMGPLVGTGVPLAIVPAGTGNLLAGNLGIPTRLPEAARVAAGPVVRRIDVGRASWGRPDGGEARGERHFAIALGAGFDARVMAATDPAAKRRFGKLAYFATAAGLAGLVEAVPHAVTIDGERRELGASQVMVANLGELVPGLLGPRFPVIPDDGLLDVLVFTATDPFRGLLGAWEALIQPEPGDHPGGRVFRLRAREVAIEAVPAQPVELDGDPRGTTPVTASIVPGGVDVVVRDAGSRPRLRAPRPRLGAPRPRLPLPF